MNHENNEYVTVVGIFQSHTDAQAAVRELSAQNLRVDDVSVVERDASRFDESSDYAAAEYEYRQYTTEELGNETLGGMVLGSLVGGTLGTLAGLGALVIPGIGPIVAAGPLVGALVGGTSGAITGTIAGALIEAFEIPEEHATIYERRLGEGRSLVAAHVDRADAPAVRRIFAEQKAERFDWAEPTGERDYYWV